MSDLVLQALIIAVAPTITAVSTLLVALRVDRKIELVHKATNSMKDELVIATRVAATLVGRAEGVAAEQAAQEKSGQ